MCCYFIREFNPREQGMGGGYEIKKKMTAHTKMCYETGHCLVSSLIDYSTSRGLGKAIKGLHFRRISGVE